MSENEAIEYLQNRYLVVECPANPPKEECEKHNAVMDMAIKALEEVRQYRALEKRLSDMFRGSLTLGAVVDDLELALKEPDSPHPMNARILTYKESADWDAYRAIGTVEELAQATKYMRLAKQHGIIGNVIDKCAEYEAIGTVEECRAAMEKQKAKRPDYEGDGYADGQLVYDTWICPCCGKRYEVDYDNYDYCPNCGQKIKRRDEE